MFILSIKQRKRNNMRLDKFLKVSRLIKRRTIAKEVLEHGLADVNNHKAKPASEIRIGDIIHIRLGRHLLTIEVMDTADTPTRKSAGDLYRILEDKVIETDGNSTGQE